MAADDAPNPVATDAAGRVHLRYLDGLRGVAILAVVMIHSSQLVIDLARPLRDLTFYGVRGVQLFFIVSGLTLARNYAGKPLPALNYAARRFFRIAPMFYLGIAGYLLLGRTGAMALPAAHASSTDVIATLLFLHGWVPSAINTVVPGGWSIAAEAMFYVALPALLLAAPRLRLLTVIVVASYPIAGAVNLALSRGLLGDEVGRAMSLYFWPVQFPAFATGVWLAVAAPHLPRPRGVAIAVLWASVIGIAVDSQLRGHSNLLVAIVLLSAFAWAAAIVRPRWLEGRLLPFIGEISFSLYIVQFAIIGLLRPHAAAIEAAAGPTLALIALFGITLALSGVLATLTYRWIEQPVIRLTRRIGLPDEVPAGAATAAPTPSRHEALR